ncbi:MAG: oligosaccharide flippase family protein [Ignavibacteria bacterium]|nr:oligosaccharide flippase family protein [Ignavibacteria bacterium]
MREKIKQLTKDTALYGISTMVGRFLNFLLVPFYTNIFLPADYGVVTNLYALIALLNIFFLYGLDTAYLKFAASDDFADKKKVFSSAFFTLVITSIIFTTALLISGSSINKLFAVSEKYSYLLTLTGLILLFDALSALPFIYLRVARRAAKFSAIKITNIVSTIILNILLIVVLKKGIEAVFISNLVASVVTFIILLPDIISQLKIHIDKDVLKRLMKFGIPYLPGGIAAMFMQVIDRPIVEHLTDLTTLGIYQANYKLGIFMMLFVSMFQFAWQPFSLQYAKDKDAKELFSKVFTIFTVAGTSILLFLSLYITDLAKFSIHGKSLIGEAYWSGLSIVPIILAAYLFNGFYINFSAAIYIKEKSSVVPLLMGAGAVINVAANYLLIPILNITGAAFATLLSYAVMAIGFYFVSQKHFPIVYEWRKIGKTFFLLGIVATLFYSIQFFGIVELFFKTFLLLLFVGGLFGLNIIPKNELLTIKNILLRKKKDE